MTKNKVVTTEMILAKKGVIEKAPAPFYSELFGGDIVVENTHGQGIVEIIQSASNSGDETYSYSRLIYENCPIFRDKALLKEYDIDDPYLLPKTIYGSHIVEFLQLGNYILQIYGANTAVDNIKKK
jgi:hypothetical protein